MNVIRWLLSAALLLLSDAVPAAASQSPLPALLQSTNVRPPANNPKVRVLSYSPLILHLENFVSPDERRYLLDFAKPKYQRSKVVSINGESDLDDARSSSTAFLPKRDIVVTAIAKRAAELQGYEPRANVDMQVTHYDTGQQYLAHFDWFPDEKLADGNDGFTQRISTIFVILDADCFHCGTEFPKLVLQTPMQDPRWCPFVECDANVLTTKPVPGSAIFWLNLDANGKGRHDVLHAGLPVMNGTKTGLNIWTHV